MLITSHMVWGYVLGKATGRIEKVEPNVPLLILAGGLSDFDLFTRQPYNTLFGHHGISHSWVLITLLFIPVFYRFGRQTVPYYVSVIQHPMFGDLVTNHIPLLYPVTLKEYGFNLFDQNAAAAIGLEALGFAIFVVMFILSGTWKKRIEPTFWNRLWLVLWVPPVLLTSYQAVVYFTPELTTIIYSSYALVSSFTLLAAAVLIASGGLRSKRDS